LSACARDHSSVFGAGWITDAGMNFSDWTMVGFGADTRMCTAACCSTIFAPARADQGATVHHWTIGSFGDGAELGAVPMSSDGDNPSFASVFDTAFNDIGFPASVQDWIVECHGGATLVTAGYNAVSDPSAPEYNATKGDWVRLGTLGGDRNGAMRVYFTGAGDTVVNVAALKLSEAVTTVDGGSGTRQATMKLSGDQGQSNSVNYARAIALGPDFQLNVGRARALAGDNIRQPGMTLETPQSIASGGQPNGGGGTLNIFGAVGLARMSDSAPGSVLRVDSGWTVNAYGPVEDLASIAVHHGAFNTHESVTNVTLSSGDVYAYGASDGVGTIRLNGGNLRIAKCSDTHFDENFIALENGVVYIDQSRDEYGAATNNTVEIRDSAGNSAHDYPWKGYTGGGKLVVNEGETLVFHVDTSRADQSVNSMEIEGADGVFEFVNGHITIDGNVTGGLVFNGGKMRIFNDDPSNRTILPPHTDLWIIRAAGLDGIDFNPDLYDGEPTEESGQIAGIKKFVIPAEIVCCECDDCGDCAVLDGPLHVYVFRNSGVIVGGDDGDQLIGGDSSNGIYIANGADVPVSATPALDAYRQANSELASIAAETSSLLRMAVVGRLANPGGSAGGPFAALLGGRLHQDAINGFGYGLNVKGLSCGVDRLFLLADGRATMRLGVLAAYLTGNVHFSGRASGRGKIAEQKVHSGAICAAYETLGANDLKTNINLFAGLQRSKNELCRVNTRGYSVHGRLNADGQFVALEAVKILRRSSGGAQIGP
jgi:hypothetical protein